MAISMPRIMSYLVVPDKYSLFFRIRVFILAQLCKIRKALYGCIQNLANILRKLTHEAETDFFPA